MDEPSEHAKGNETSTEGQMFYDCTYTRYIEKENSLVLFSGYRVFDFRMMKMFWSGYGMVAQCCEYP